MSRRPGVRATEPEPPQPIGRWLRGRARAASIGNVVVYLIIAATAASRASHGVLSPAGLVAVVAGAAFAAATTGWVAGFYEGAKAARDGTVLHVRPATSDGLRGRLPWRSALAWAGWASLWCGAAAVVLAAVLRERSAPFAVLAVALLAITAPAAVAVDLAARAAGAGAGAALRDHRAQPVPVLRRAWSELALPAGLLQAVVNGGVAWVLFHGDAAEGTLSRSVAFGDALLMAVILAGVFGSLGTTWGDLDATTGRVPLGRLPRERRTPIGPQALVYAGAVVVLATPFVARLVPATAPSIERVALVRGLLAGGLALVACAFGYVRGVANAASAPDATAPLLAPVRPGAGGRSTRHRLASLSMGSAGVALLLAAVAPLVGAGRAEADDLTGRGLVAELDAVGVRVEYDIPAPAGTGSVPQVVGLVRRSGGSEAANGIAAAPSRLDPVVGGTYADPDKERKGDENAVPQAECAYPGDLADIEFAFPSDVRPEAAGLVPLGWSTAHCGAGPRVELHATAGSPDAVSQLGPLVSVGGVVADAFAGPVDGVLQATASARASDVSILDGLIEVESVIAAGHSRTDGKPGGAASDATVDLVGVEIGGVRFDVRNGDLVVDGETLPAGGSAATAFLRGVSAAVAPTGCRLAVLDTPAAYPQGFLFGRPEPELGVADDGSLAASMTGGLLVQCEIPDGLSEATGFSPQRLQVVLGFAFTGVSAREDIGGFGLGALGGGTSSGGPGGGLVAVPPVPVGAATTPSLAPPAVGTVDAGAGVGEAVGAPAGAGTITERIELLAANFAEGRAWLWLGALVLWAVLTHRGLARVRREIAQVSA